jgi:hypothetical protein
MGRVLTAKASARPRRFVPSAAQAAGTAGSAGKPLAGTFDQRLNNALTMLCGLQVSGGRATAAITAR